jgi:hypothetical protein
MNYTKSLFIASLFLLGSCAPEKTYRAAELNIPLRPYLNFDAAVVFAYSDTLIIYDTAFLNDALLNLRHYEDKIAPEDKAFQQQISAQRAVLETQTPLSLMPEYFVPTKALLAQFANNEKGERWLRAYPQQFAAAKTLLQTPDRENTLKTIRQLEFFYDFLQNNSVEEADKITAAIKDFLAFLNSKLKNNETQN